jgi:hypothetical protein
MTNHPRARLLTTGMLVCAIGWGPTPTASAAAAAGECTATQRGEALRAMQDEVLAIAPRRLPSLDAAIRPGGRLAGWRLSHGHVVLAEAGAVGVDDIRAQPPMPQLLLYAPSPASAPTDWLDFDGEDGPYDLVGWAYIGRYEPGSEPPRKPCIDGSEWLVHEAGWHLANGGMLLTPNARAEPPRPDAPVHFWHPRAWDLHVWLGADAIPVVAYANPSARAGGVRLPAGAFLRVAKGRLVPLPG